MKITLRFIQFTVLSVLCAPFLVSAAQITVTLSAGAITPANITINPGDTVIWSNTSGTNQSVTANNGTFQSGTIAPTGSFAATFNTPGTYQYYDNAAGSAIVGSVIVAQTSAQTANPNYNFNTGVGTSQNTNSTLSSQTQALIAQITALQAQLQGAGAGTSLGASAGACPSLTRTLGPGMSGSDVSALQSFLARNPSIYPEGQVTGYFGALTRAAVQRFQVQYSIVSSGGPPTTGYGLVGPRTIAAIGSVCAGGTSGAGSGNPNTQGTVSGYMQVSPVSGNAPLTVSANVTVNTANSCTGGTYTLNWGDGTVPQTITAPQGNCSQLNQVLQHVYAAGGTFQVVLSAGSHQTTATVTVSGGTTTTTNPSQPVGSITAFTTSGATPLPVTFYVSCASGLAYDVVFGDGQELGGQGVSQSACNGGLQSIPHTYTTAGSYTAQLIGFIRNAQGVVGTQVLGTVQITAGTPSSGTGTIVSYAQPTLTQSAGGNPLAVSLAFVGDACSGAYTIDWGDGNVPMISPIVDFVTCSSTQTKNYTKTYTYGHTGTYTITLRRGIPNSSSVQTDTMGVSIIQ